MVRPREWIHGGCPDAPSDTLVETAKARKRSDEKAQRVQRLVDQELRDATSGPVCHIGSGTDMPVNINNNITLDVIKRAGEVGGAEILHDNLNPNHDAADGPPETFLLAANACEQAALFLALNS